MNVVERVASSSWFAAAAPKFVPQMDLFAHRLTGGRVLPSALYLPLLLLTTTGCRSGLPRTVPITTFPHGDDFIVVGSNYGRPHHPAWTSNLLANPAATVEYRTRSFPVTARLAPPGEKAELWPGIAGTSPHFEVYAQRSGRDVRVFVLEPA